MEATPFAAAPIQVGSQVFTTDENGSFTVQVAEEQDATIASGLLALKIEEINHEQRETLPGTGAQIAEVAATNGGVISVVVSSRIRPEPLCLSYSVDTGAEVIWFRYTNRFGEALEVQEQKLNSISSPSGLPYPIARFESTDETKPDGYLGFEWALDYFKGINPATNAEIIRVVWKLLGKEVSLEQPIEEVPLCANSGELADCSRLSASMRNRLFELTASTVRNLSDAAQLARKRKLWKPIGSLRQPYQKQAAKALREIRAILNRLPKQAFVCPERLPSGCSEQIFPKAALLSSYQSIFKVKLPTGLRHLAKLYPAERRRFLEELNRLPDRFAACSR